MIIGFVALHNATRNKYPADFCLPTVTFVDKLIVFCGTADDLGIASNLRYPVAPEIVLLEGQINHWSHIARYFNACLEWIRLHCPACEIIVKTDADLYLCDTVKKPFFDWLGSDASHYWPFHVPVMRVVLYSCTYENYFGFSAFPNRKDLEFVKDGAYLNQGGYDPREPGRKMTEEFYALELGQTRPHQLAAKDRRNEFMFGSIGTQISHAQTFQSGGNLEMYLQAMRDPVREYKDYRQGGVEGFNKFVGHPVGQAFLDHYRCREEAATVRRVLWDYLREWDGRR